MERWWRERARAALSAGGVLDDDVAEELAQHAAAVYESALGAGADEDEALRRADAELVLPPEAPRELRRRPARPPAVEPPPARAGGLSGLVYELHHALRRLAREPWHATLVVATLAIGIGSTTLLFSVVNGVLLAPLPWASGQSLVRLAETREGATRGFPWTLTNGTYLALAEGARTIDGIAAWDTASDTWSTDGAAERVQIVRATAGLFPLLQAGPQLGRVFTASEERDHVLVLSHGLWQRRYGASPKAIGQAVRLNGETYRVIGVMPRGFAFPNREVAAWAPYHVEPVAGPNGNMSIWLFSAVARLRSGVTLAQATDEATVLARHVPDYGLASMAMFGTRGAPKVSVRPAKEALTAEVRPALLILLAAIGLLLAAATANVASLQLVRATARHRELAIRSALGAGQGRLARLLLAESLILGVLGGAAGLALAAVGVRALPSLLPADFPRLDAVTLDLHVTGFCVGLALFCGLGAGLLPALSAGRLRVAAALAAEARGTVRGAWPAAVRARTAILAGQVAIATVLLLGALQLGRSFFNLLSARRGYEADHLLTVKLPLPDRAYDAHRRQQVITQVLARLRGLPGVSEAAMADVVPLASFDFSTAWSVFGPDGSRQMNASVKQVTPGYFRALGRRILDGRPLLESDVGFTRVVVVSQTFARRYLHPPFVGASLANCLPGRQADWTVVGVVEDLVHGSVTDPMQPEIVVDYRQAGAGLQNSEPTLLVRTSAEPQALIPVVRAVLREADPTLAPEAIVPMSHLLRQSLARPRLYSVLLALFAGCALVVVGVGLFGSLSYGVALRTREIGVRKALGARPRDIGLLITRQGLVVAGAGVAVGLVASLAFGRLLRDLLYGVRPHDTLSLLAVPALLLVLAMGVALVPALRAATIDPQEALRAE